ncbi:MAG TPA: tetratricopeptide repeat protein [Candidatus Saccharimonadales bacterium]|nr:tetratricopeptide repeat protein [Candidatus Saccharimonadales bacterium]
MIAAIAFVLATAAGGWLVARPYLRPAATGWPADPPDRRDDVARAVSSLRDLRFAEAAGTIDPADAGRLRLLLERSAFAGEPPAALRRAPVRTLLIGALLAGITAVLVAQNLPQEAGDRAPGGPLTGTVGAGAPSITVLEGRAKASPRDIPTLLALADAYRQEGRTRDAVASYQTVLGLDRDSVPALNGLALILVQAGEADAAGVATDRVLVLRPKDPDALFLKGLLRYKAQDWPGAVSAWKIYLDVGEFHPAAPMVRELYADAVRRAGGS